MHSVSHCVTLSTFCALIVHPEHNGSFPSSLIVIKLCFNYPRIIASIPWNPFFSFQLFHFRFIQIVCGAATFNLAFAFWVQLTFDNWRKRWIKIKFVVSLLNDLWPLLACLICASFCLPKNWCGVIRLFGTNVKSFFFNLFGIH